jgi:AraC-like DNA-binding protein
MQERKQNLIRSWHPADLTRLEMQRGWSVYRPVPRHWHEEYQFVLIEGGEGSLTYRGAEILTPPAGLFIVHPGEVHSNRAFNRHGCSFRTIFFATDLFAEAAAEIRWPGTGLPFFPATIVFERDTVNDFIELHRSFEQENGTLERGIKLKHFLVNFIARYAEQPVALNPTGAEKTAVRRAREYLTENYAENITLEQLASLAELSPFHFSRVFTEASGLPPHEFQVQVRLAQAKQLLRDRMDIAQVAFQTGFSDQSHLTRRFKRVFGITPGQFASQVG